MMDNGTFVCPDPGPLAREALDVIGLPSDVPEVRIELRTNLVTVNGRRVTPADATLVRNAVVCDPHPSGPEPRERDLEFVRRALVIRALLNVPAGAEGED
ncbi:protein of unknown function [Methylorubrum extorquens]|uniref:Uncharacterized protein n=1 Tax=Methylorubrum extorquens TaxID=408 RepID=A0A2N9ATJ2_METEX|nr:protein of unknown function [Methylorubrum extorquens]